ncbi:MAG: hypothetical protein PHD97_07690 [Bacteroidales bacterium]|nr:hypothetical protein [Bacteroidales bacterium]
MKKYFLISVFILAVSAVKPQISIYGGYNSLFSNYTTFNTFVDSYNAYQTDMLSKCGHSGFMGGYTAGVTYSAMVFLCDINYNQIFCTRTAKFQDGGSRRMDLKYNYIVTGIGIGKQFEKIGIWAVGYLNFGDIYLNSYYEFQDGSKDIGSTRQLNGCYVGMVAMKFMYGIKTSIKVVKNLNLLIYAGYMAKNSLGWKDDYSHFTLQDLSYGKMLDGRMDEIPTDYKKYWELGGTTYAYRTYTDKWNSTVGCDLGGFNLSIGIKWDIPGTKTE